MKGRDFTDVWQAEAQSLAADRAVQIFDSHPDTPREILALALEIQADALGRSSAGTSAWERASVIRRERVSALEGNAAELPKANDPPPLKVGSGVSTPVLTSKIEPEYTEAARLNKLQGAVLLKLVIGADGVPRDFKLIRGCGYGLDEQAAQAVSRWRFQPSVKDGNPVPTMAQIEVNFRLL